MPTPTNILQPMPEECESGQKEEETNLDNQYDGDIEIVEQSELDHFNAILQKAQTLAAKKEREKP